MSLKTHIMANYLGQGWSALMLLIFTPLYIHYLGLANYGLIGVFSILQAFLVLFDLGMSQTLNREMAKYKARQRTTHSIRELLFSVEVLTLSLALGVIAGVCLAAPLLISHWLMLDKIDAHSALVVIRLMGVVIALRLLEGIYRGAILGLHQHVWLNAVTALAATARGAGVVGVLAWLSPSVEAFFIWQGLVSLLITLALVQRVHMSLPAVAVHFSWTALRAVWSFARGIMASTLLAFFLMQADKILLARQLGLETLGIYTLAWNVASALFLLAVPLAQSYYPHFTQLVSQADRGLLSASYHQAAQLMTMIIVPATLLLLVYGEPLLIFWTRNPDLSHQALPLLRLLASGMALIALEHIPYHLQLAFGWSSFTAKANALTVLLQFPVLYWALHYAGALGLAWAWFGVIALYVLLIVWVMHYWVLPQDKWLWYGQDTLFPALGAGLVCATLYSMTPQFHHSWHLLAWLLLNYGLMMLVAGLCAPAMREIAYRLYLQFLSKRW